MSSSSTSLPNLITFLEDRQLIGLSNWAVFCDHLKSVAHPTGLNGHLDGIITAPAAGPAPVPPAPAAAPAMPINMPINSQNPSLKEWELCNGCLADMKSHRMWTTLIGVYETTSAAAQSLTKEPIHKFKYIPGIPYEEYFQQLESLQKAASNVSCTVTNEDLQSQFLTSLSPDHLWILQNHSSHTYPKLKCMLLKYDMMVESSITGPNTSPVANALATTG
ncbi:hypothetical protein GYMLUDRAFT_251226 [Collybiopsis luxurians FD-317 M1]|uniref:Uncharacterized protein n=1 Tax=Collybiopsis luxurians FD-317 M1 TaxID=944289 RepID=A0A0D0BD33_9AGAR|nr:hypothetical protein GYMLUDRAFT_251226 [Collybiopsis luxurians FD-317 M1]